MGRWVEEPRRAVEPDPANPRRVGGEKAHRGGRYKRGARQRHAASRLATRDLRWTCSTAAPAPTGSPQAQGPTSCTARPRPRTSCSQGRATTTSRCRTGARDSANRGRGHDIVNAELTDLVAADRRSSPARSRAIRLDRARPARDAGRAGQHVRRSNDRHRFQTGRTAERGEHRLVDPRATEARPGFRASGRERRSSPRSAAHSTSSPILSSRTTRRIEPLIASPGVSTAGTVLLGSAGRADGPSTWSLPVAQWSAPPSRSSTRSGWPATTGLRVGSAAGATSPT